MIQQIEKYGAVLKIVGGIFIGAIGRILIYSFESLFLLPLLWDLPAHS